MRDQDQHGVLEVFNGYKDDRKALIQGLGKLDRQGNLVRLEAIDEFVPLDSLDVPARLDEFRALKDGWLEGDGRAPDHAGLDWLSDSFERHYPDDMPLPYTYPTSEGGVEMEWSLGSQEISLEIDFQTHMGYWHDMDMTSSNDEDKDLDLDDASVWTWLAGEIRRYAKKAQ